MALYQTPLVLHFQIPLHFGIVRDWRVFVLAFLEFLVVIYLQSKCLMHLRSRNLLPAAGCHQCAYDWTFSKIIGNLTANNREKWLFWNGVSRQRKHGVMLAGSWCIHLDMCYSNNTYTKVPLSLLCHMDTSGYVKQGTWLDVNHVSDKPNTINIYNHP